MEHDNFLIEEYKQIHDTTKNFQAAYTKFELYAFGGTAAAYAFLVLNKDKMPAFAWWIVPGLLLLCAIRCFGYYYIINKKLAVYLEQIERHFHAKTQFKGFHNTHTSSWPGRNTNIAFNMFAWAALLIATTFAAIYYSTNEDAPVGQHPNSATAKSKTSH
jgi:hypothetical protein